MLTGCLGTKYLKENERHLLRQSIRVPENISEEDLRAQLAQRPNRRLLGLPIYHLVAMYYAGLKRYDKEKYVRKKEAAEKKFDDKIAKTSSQKKINNLQFRKQKKIDRFNSRIENGNLLMQWGEPIAVYDSNLVKTTLDRFSIYLFAQGYFHNTIDTRINSISSKFVTLTYRVDPGRPYVIDSIFYRIQDTTLVALLERTSIDSYVRKGDRYREDNFTRERERIDLMLKDNGYYDFSRQYVDFDVDTSTLGNRRIAVMITIRNPAKRGFHKQFTIDSVRFTTDAGVSRPNMTRRSRMYRDVRYSYFENYYSLKILSQRLFVTPEDPYSRTNTFSSVQQLLNLDAFKFVNINYDTSGGKFIANIFASPLSRYEWSNEVGVNVTQGYPGPFYNISFKKRNIFRGLENFELNGRIGFEGVASAADQLNVYKSTEAGANASIILPQFLWPLRNSTQVNLAKFNPKTRLSVGYTYTDRPEYQRTSSTISNTYTWENKRITKYSLAVTNISLINSRKSHDFDSILNRLDSLGNYNLARSFSPSLVSSMIFGITWNRNYGTFDKNATFVRAQLESGGTSLNFIDPKIISRQGLQYFKYIRASFDFRRLRILSNRATLAYRVNTGVAWSYDKANRTLPYEKFYFAGGSNSVRAWRPRRLGLGSLPPPISEDPENDGMFNYQYEEPGEILAEGSVELRSKVVGFIDGAVFVDAGNVWSFEPVTGEARGNSQFKLNSFFKELGIGTGFGLRFDFTFLIMRFDIGIKAYDPAREPGDRFVLDEARFFGPFARTTDTGDVRLREPVIYNIGIGYPF